MLDLVLRMLDGTQKIEVAYSKYVDTEKRREGDSLKGGPKSYFIPNLLSRHSRHQNKKPRNPEKTRSPLLPVGVATLTA